MTKHPVLENDLIASRLKSLWVEVDAGRISEAEFLQEEAQMLSAYRAIWTDALTDRLEGSLKETLCREISELEGNPDINDVEARCRRGVQAMKEEWEDKVAENDLESVVAYYDESKNYPYELMWWHTLEEDQSPLAYVAALHLALRNGCANALDFGAGVGSGALLFAKYDMAVTCGDISSTLLDFAHRRLDKHRIAAQYLDLKSETLPDETFDFIMAMDVFEHIAEPEKTVAELIQSLRPGGILFGRFASEIDSDRPSHIARDFEPTFQLLKDAGCVECFRDEWFWGHQAFQKPFAA